MPKRFVPRDCCAPTRPTCLPAFRVETWTFAYRYAAVPFELTLAVEKVQPRVQTDSLLEASLQPERLTLSWTVLYTIERAGMFRLELEMPAGYQVHRVHGVTPVRTATAVQVDGYHLEGEKQDRLVVELSHKALGRVGLNIELVKELHEPALLAPTEKAAVIPLAVPRPLGAIERSSGRLIVYAPDSLRVNQAKTGRRARDYVPRGSGARVIGVGKSAGGGSTRAGFRLHARNR